MSRAIHLHGRLGRQFGPRFDLEVETPAEAVRALITMVPRFREALVEGDYRVIRGRTSLPAEGLDLRFGACRELHIIPVPAGAKNSGVGKIVAGVVLVVAAVVTYGAAAGWFGAASAAVTAAEAGGVAGAAHAAAMGASAIGVSGVLTVSQLGFMGLGMILTGASMLLSPQPKSQGPLTADQNPSFLFTGPVNTTAQGGPVPLVYGKMRVGSVVGAAALKAEDYVSNPTFDTSTPAGKLAAILADRKTGEIA